MLNLTTIRYKTILKVIVLHLFISFFTFQPLVFAAISNEAAEEYRLKGYEQQQKGNFDQALSHYTKAVSLGADNPEVYNDMAILYERIGLNNRAESYYQKAILQDKSFLPAYMNLAYLYLKVKNSTQALEYFKKRYELGELSDPWTEKAKDELLKLRPEYIKWIEASAAEMLDKELVKKSHDEFNQRIERSKEMYQSGMGYFEQNEYKKALYEFNRALVLAPNTKEIVNAKKQVIIEMSKENVRKRSEQAVEMLNSGNTISARNEIQRILTEMPNDPIIISK